MDISKLDVISLKSLAYDAISEAELIQKNLTIINNEIAKKKDMERIAMEAKTEEVKPANKK